MKNDETEPENKLEKVVGMLKNNLVWSLESRLLIRYIVENLPDTNQQSQAATLEKYKESANNYIQGMLGDAAK